MFDRAFKPEPEFLELPRSRFLGEPDFSRAEFDSYYYSYNFEHEFSDNWKIRQGLGILDIEGGIQEINLGQLEEDRRRIPRTAFKTDESQQNYSLQTEQFEVGVKQEFFQGRLAGTLAFFDITKQNVLTTDPEDFDFSVQTGEQKSRGIELDISGEILPGWNVITTYAYTDAFVSEDNTIPEGDKLAGVPRHSGSVWTTYTIQSGDLEGLGFGLGLYLFGEREGLLPNNDFEIPGYFRADASIFYRRDRWRAAVNFKNIFNEKYYETQGFLVYPQAPFTVLGNVAIEF